MAVLRILLVSTPIGTLGSGLGGGVEITVLNIAAALSQYGHDVTILAGEGSVAAGHRLLTATGISPPNAQHLPRDAPIVMPVDGLLANFFDVAQRCQGDYDVILNLAYDWLPFYLTPFFRTPLLHVVGMGSLGDAVDLALRRVVTEYPGRVAVHTHAQAATFSFGKELVVISNGLDLSRYRFNPQPDPALGWVARISREKGLEDAAAAAAEVGLALRVWGVVEDAPYWAEVQRKFPGDTIDFKGFLPTDQLQAELGRVQALLVTPKWVEAFGNVVAESLAVGVPVIAYRRGGPAEIVRDASTGFLVEADSISGLVQAIRRLPEIDRSECRAQAEAEFSLPALGKRLLGWVTPQLR